MAKGFLKPAGNKVWLIVTSILVVVLLAVNIAIQNTMIYQLLCLVLGRATPVYVEGSAAMYEATVTTKAEALANANAKNLELCEEGFVLLKNENNALPLDKGAKVSVFGKNSVNLSYGGSGSSGFDGVEYTDLYASLSEAGFKTNPTLKSFYENNNKSGAKREANSSDLDSGGNQKIATAETPQSKYTSDVKASYADYSDAALVVITRIGGEGFDLPRYQGDTEGAYAADSHYLELDANERDLLEAVCAAGFEKVVVLFNIPSAFEATFLEEVSYLSCADKIDAALWFGFTGGVGAEAVGEILNGEVNPSGKTVDTWSADFTKDPTFVNFGTGSTPEDSDQYDAGLYYFVDYEEGIYVGYRYYETRALTDGEEWYAQNVVYPFGYGLSYTEFEWTVKSVSDTTMSKDKTISVEVEVKNTGNVAGKEVVELYAAAPYTAGGIEKPAKVLVGFAKTEELKKGESETVAVTFEPYTLASYDYRDANQNGFAGYELEAGEYTLYVSRNAHDVEGNPIKLTLSEDIQYADDPVTEKTVGNRYTADNSVTEVDLSSTPDSDAQLSTVLSRSDWTGTWPNKPTAEERAASAATISSIKDTATNNPNDYSEEEYPWFGEETGLTVRDMLPEDTPEESYLPIVDYNDEKWEELLSTCTEDELIQLLNYGAYQTLAVESINMPLTQHADGPSGFTCFMNKANFKNTCHYCSEPVMASTWNVELMEEMGKVMGEEGIVGNGTTPYSSIYAPGVNIHRSLFGGRCAEYFSEDPFLTGKMAAAEIRGCQSKGVIMTVKHFVANEQETHRSINGDCSWLTEQALREIYLKPFEMAVKEGKTRGIMSSFNRIGTKWTGGDYRLLTEILREEWGFEGMVICDFNTVPQYMNSRQMAYAGGDLNLATTPESWCDASDTSDAVVLMKCAKNILYTFINSNAMKGEIDHYEQPLWPTLIYLGTGVIAAGLVVWTAVVIIRYKKSQNEG